MNDDIEGMNENSVAILRQTRDAINPAQQAFLNADWSTLSDERLVSYYHQATTAQRGAYLMRCKAVWQYRENHVQAWGESWLDVARERFEVGRDALINQSNIWKLVAHRATYSEELTTVVESPTLAKHIGRMAPERGAVALEVAEKHVTEFGRKPTVPELEREIGNPAPAPQRESPPLVWGRCPACGMTGSKDQFEFKDYRAH